MPAEHACWPTDLSMFQLQSERQLGIPPSGPQALGLPQACAGPAGAPTKLRVLVADDSRTNRRILELMLKNMGHDVVLAGDGLEAVEAFELASFDLVLLDGRMPRLDGPSAACVMRTIEAKTHRERTSIFAVTGGLGSAACKESGIDGVLEKPFMLSDLTAVVGACCPAA